MAELSGVSDTVGFWRESWWNNLRHRCPVLADKWYGTPAAGGREVVVMGVSVDCHRDAARTQKETTFSDLPDRAGCE